jgi:nucleoid-associated protein YgaU
MQNQVKSRSANTGARIKHTVKAGESLASIALKEYGDARFARLILTINRGEVANRCDGFKNYAFIFPSQILLLPTAEEAQIYERQFFTETSRAKFDLAHYARPAMPSDIIPSVVLNSFSISNKEVDQHVELESTAKKLAASKLEQKQAAEAREDQLRAAKERAERVKAEFIKAEEVRLAAEQESQNELQAAAKLASQRPHLHLVAENTAPNRHSGSNSQFNSNPPSSIDMTPPAAAQKAASKRESQRQIEIADDHELFFSQGTLEITSLSHYCRLMKFEAMEAQASLMIKLQVFDQNRWQTIASYVVQKDATQRLAHYSDGSFDFVNLELPRAVVKELSVSDFNRNWKNYTKVYFNHKEKTRLEQLTGPAKMMLHAV